MALLISEENFSNAWRGAKNFIVEQPSNHCNNLIVSIENPLEYDLGIHQQYEVFCERFNLKNPDKVAATIFPKKAFTIVNEDREKLYNKYPRIHKIVKGRWGSYFNQMINWEDSGGAARNQIEDIINMINSRDRVHKAAYTIQIPNPVRYLGWPRGLPCLHQILIQLEGIDRSISLLAIYRNHDFGEKAYGNYMGLGHLLEFIANEIQFEIGRLTCVSSHAYISNNHSTSLRAI